LLQAERIAIVTTAIVVEVIRRIVPPIALRQRRRNRRAECVAGFRRQIEVEVRFDCLQLHDGESAVGTADGIRGVLVYMATYVFMSAGVFACIIAMRRRGRSLERISDLSGLARTDPGLALAMAVFNSTPSQPSSIAALTSLAVPTPASTITG